MTSDSPQTKQAARRLDSLRRALSVFTTPVISIGIAFGCNLCWVMMVFQSMGIFHGFENGEAVLDNAYLISIVCTTVTLGALALGHKRARNILGTTPMRVAIPAAMAISTLLMMGAGAPGAAGTFCLWASGVLSGVSSAFFLMYFGVTLSMLSLRQSLGAIALGYAFSALAFEVYLFFSPLEAALCAASTAPVGMAFLHFGVRTLGLQKQQEKDPLPPQSLPADAGDRQRLRRLIIAFMLCMFVVGAAYELSRTLYIQLGGYATDDVTRYALVQGGANTVVALGAMGLTLALSLSRTTWGPQVCYRLTVFFTVLGALLLPAPLLLPDLPVFLPLAINNAAFLCLNMMMWVLVTGTCRHYFTSCLHIFGWVRCAWAAGPLVGMLLGRWLWTSGPLTAASLFVAAVLCVSLIFLVESFVFTEKTLAETLDLMPTHQRSRFQDRCRAVAERFGLTEREAEVMQLFAKGRTLPYIQKELCLSKSTVSSHRQHIYQKLGVHSSQEMIDLIQQEG